MLVTGNDHLLQFGRRLLVALGSGHKLIVVLDLLEEVLSDSKGRIEILRFDGGTSQLDLQLAHLEQRDFLVPARPPLNETTAVQGLCQLLVADLLVHRPSRGQRLAGANLLPEDSQRVGTAPLTGGMLAQPLGGLGDHQHVVQTDQLEQQHLLLEPSHRQRPTRVVEQVLVDAHGLVDVILFLERLALPHPGVESENLAAIPGADRFEFRRGLRQQFLVLNTAAGPRLGLLVGAQRQVILGPHVHGLGPFTLFEAVPLLDLVDEGGKGLPGLLVLAVRRLKNPSRLDDQLPPGLLELGLLGRIGR